MTKPRRLCEFGGRDILSGPVVTTDAVYGGTRDFRTVRLDRKSLKPLWTVDSDELDVRGPIGDTLLGVGSAKAGGVRQTSDGRLLWCSESPLGTTRIWKDHVLTKGEDGLQVRLAETGAVWRTYEIPGGYEAFTALDDETAVLQQDNVLTALNLRTGDVRWQRPLLDEMKERVLSDSDSHGVRVTVGSRRGVLVAFRLGATFAISTEDGSIRLHTPGVWCPDAWPTVHGGRVYAYWGRHLWALDEETGAVVYDVNVSSASKIYGERPGTLYAGRLAVAHLSGLLAIFNAADGTLVNEYQAKVPLWTTAEVDGRLLVATGDGTLLVFDSSIWGA